MKIERKLMLSNISITIVAMIMLAMAITNIVEGYIEKDIKKDLVKENRMMTKWISYGKILEDDGSGIKADLYYYRKSAENPIVSMVFLYDGSGDMVAEVPNGIVELLDGEDRKTIFGGKMKREYDIDVGGKPFLAYNDKTEAEFQGEKYSFLVVTMFSKFKVKQISSEISDVLVISIILISLLLMAVTSYNGRRITHPIEELMKITSNIAGKNFEQKADLNTGDELQSLAESINLMAESLKKHDEDQKKFYENISHELKTPVTSISGYAQGIKAGIFDEDEEALDKIVELSNQLKKQLEDIIYLSKLDGINETFNFKKENMNMIIAEAIDKFDSMIILNDIDVEYEPESQIVIEVDREKMLRAVANVISNCVKYTRDRIKITSCMEGNSYCLEISDNGSGFDSKILEKPFVRGIKGEKDGSGIGLSIIKKVIDGHDGQISIRNKMDSGAVYSIKLPVGRKA